MKRVIGFLMIAIVLFFTTYLLADSELEPQGGITLLDFTLSFFAVSALVLAIAAWFITALYLISGGKG